MLLLVSGATRYPRGAQIGHLIVPRQWNDPAELHLEPGQWAMDNGCFTGLDAGAYMRMLYAYRAQVGCRFVTVPDAVADAAETRALWKFWRPVVAALGHPPAFVAQDGLTPGAVPWDELGALFIGGSTAFKEGPIARTLIGLAKARGLWVHVGRVNSERRYRLMLAAGVDSIDGSGFSRYPDGKIPLAEDWRTADARAPRLQL